MLCAQRRYKGFLVVGNHTCGGMTEGEMRKRLDGRSRILNKPLMMSWISTDNG